MDVPWTSFKNKKKPNLPGFPGRWVGYKSLQLKGFLQS